jgi:hypothetical protein
MEDGQTFIQFKRLTGNALEFQKHFNRFREELFELTQEV